jgi:hypothetical protein
VQDCTPDIAQRSRFEVLLKPMAVWRTPAAFGSTPQQDAAARPLFACLSPPPHQRPHILVDELALLISALKVEQEAVQHACDRERANSVIRPVRAAGGSGARPPAMQAFVSHILTW